MTVFSGGGLAGRPAGGFFGQPPGWVNKSLPPGMTSQELSGFGKALWWIGYIKTGIFIFMNPNLVWFLMAVTTYFIVPYDFVAAARWDLGFIALRVAINVMWTWLYYGFWHVSIYTLRWANRKFDNRTDGPTLAQVIHNIWYTTFGALQWTAWELCFVNMYATGRLSYTTNAEAFGTWKGGLVTLGLILYVPIMRELHFYTIHRFIHIRPLYKFVHSLHHRNVDPEPFSGLCMHPIEHLYYYSCMALPCLYIPTSPLIMYWIGLQAAISPACPHSGMEDHWHCDQFHMIHHAKFECNYGIPAIPLDKWFGTYRDKIRDDATYKGAATDEPLTTETKEAERTYLSGGLSPLWSGKYRLISQTKAHAVFDASWLAAFLVVGYMAVSGGATRATPAVAAALAAWVALGPVFVGAGLNLALGDPMSPRWPFHQEPILKLLCHVIAALIVAVLPTFQTVATLLS